MIYELKFKDLDTFKMPSYKDRGVIKVCRGDSGNVIRFCTFSRGRSEFKYVIEIVKEQFKYYYSEFYLKIEIYATT